MRFLCHLGRMPPGRETVPIPLLCVRKNNNYGVDRVVNALPLSPKRSVQRKSNNSMSAKQKREKETLFCETEIRKALSCGRNLSVSYRVKGWKRRKNAASIIRVGVTWAQRPATTHNKNYLERWRILRRRSLRRLMRFLCHLGRMPPGRETVPMLGQDCVVCFKDVNEKADINWRQQTKRSKCIQGSENGTKKW